MTDGEISLHGTFSLASFVIREFTIVMKGQDVLVLLKLACRKGQWAYAELAGEPGLSASEVHAAVKQSEEAGLYNPRTRQQVRDAPPLDKKMRFEPREAPVMPLEGGAARGPAAPPLYPCAPRAAAADERLYQMLALVDALRTGKARERGLAAEALAGMLEQPCVAAALSCEKAKRPPGRRKGAIP